jgi:Holliday junction resolvase RusA-like endonuclease
MLVTVKHKYGYLEDAITETEILNSDDDIRDMIIEEVSDKIKEGNITTIEEIKKYATSFTDQFEDEYEFILTDYCSKKDIDNLITEFNDLSEEIIDYNDDIDI